MSSAAFSLRSSAVTASWTHRRTVSTYWIEGVDEGDRLDGEIVRAIFSQQFCGNRLLTLRQNRHFLVYRVRRANRFVLIDRCARQ